MKVVQSDLLSTPSSNTALEAEHSTVSYSGTMQKAGSIDTLLHIQRSFIHGKTPCHDPGPRQFAIDSLEKA